ncbi:NAD(P)-binding domain-containing protein [Caldicellulosiruptoraceae bacterium PP1]
MIKIGIIGYGSMGSMLLNSFIASGGVKPCEVIVSTRTKDKLKSVSSKWDGINIAVDNIEVVKKAKCIFICVKPQEVEDILDEIRNFITLDTHIVSIAATVSIENIEKIVNCKITKLTPAITSEVFDGISLVCHNNKVNREDAAFLKGLLNKISIVNIIKEEDFDLAAELTSCAPGFIACIFEEFVNAVLKHTEDMPKQEIAKMVLRTLYATSKVFIEKGMTFKEVIDRVATKGGITEEGVKVLKAKLPQVFDEMFEQTLNKRKMKKEVIDSIFMDFK